MEETKLRKFKVYESYKDKLDLKDLRLNPLAHILFKKAGLTVEELCNMKYFEMQMRFDMPDFSYKQVLNALEFTFENTWHNTPLYKSGRIFMASYVNINSRFVNQKSMHSSFAMLNS